MSSFHILFYQNIFKRKQYKKNSGVLKVKGGEQLCEKPFGYTRTLSVVVEWQGGNLIKKKGSSVSNSTCVFNWKWW